MFHVSLLERYIANPLPGRTIPPPPPVEIDGEEEFEVEAIVDSRKFRKQLQYRVQWKGYAGVDEYTWESPEDVNHCPDLVAAFHERYPKKPGPVPSLPVIAP